MTTLGIDPTEVLAVSAKTGHGRPRRLPGDHRARPAPAGRSRRRRSGP